MIFLSLLINCLTFQWQTLNSMTFVDLFRFSRQVVTPYKCGMSLNCDKNKTTTAGAGQQNGSLCGSSDMAAFWNTELRMSKDINDDRPWLDVVDKILCNRHWKLHTVRRQKSPADRWKKHEIWQTSRKFTILGSLNFRPISHNVSIWKWLTHRRNLTTKIHLVIEL